MKKIILFVLALMSVTPVFAQTKTHNLEIGYELANYKYKEPGLMNLRSENKQGVSATYTYMGGSGYLFGVDFRYLQGDVDYHGGTWDGDPFTADDLRDYYFEAALKTGRNYALSEHTYLAAYTGLGWRQLRNHLEDSGEGGYLRQSTYLYLPLGAHVIYEIPNQWRFRLTAEVDCLLRGQQISDFEDMGKITNDQTSGWGGRLSFKVERMIGQVGLFIEPFFRYWEIEDSDAVRIHVIGEGDLYLQEPKNKTREYGLKVGVSF